MGPRGLFRVSSGTVWEDRIGYSRAVRAGDRVYVSGTTATNDVGEIVSPGNAYGQALQVLRNIETALAKLGATRGSIVRTRIYLVRMEDWPDVGRAHADFFGAHRPASTLVQVARLVLHDMLVEIEAEAWAPDGLPPP